MDLEDKPCAGAVIKGGRVIDIHRYNVYLYIHYDVV